VEGGRRGGEGGGVGGVRARLVGGVGPRVALLVKGDVMGHVRLRDLLVGEQGVPWGEVLKKIAK